MYNQKSREQESPVQLVRLKGRSSRKSQGGAGGQEMAMNQPHSLFVNEGAELAELRGPGQRTLWDSLLKSISTQACQAGSDKTSSPLCLNSLKWF